MSTIKTVETRKQTERNPIKRYYEKPTRKNSIIAFCAHCMGCTAAEQGNGYTDHIERGFAEAIRHCTSFGCPHFRFRPYQVKA